MYFSINLKPLFLSNSADSHHNPSVTAAVWKEEGSLCRTQMCYKNNISWCVEMLRIGFKSAKFNKFWTTAHFNSDFVCSSSIICVSLEVSTCSKIVKIPFMGAAHPLNNPGYHRGLPVDKNQGAVVLSDTELHFCWQIHDLELSQVLLSLFHLSARWAGLWRLSSLLGGMSYSHWIWNGWLPFIHLHLNPGEYAMKRAVIPGKWTLHCLYISDPARQGLEHEGMWEIITEGRDGYREGGKAQGFKINSLGRFGMGSCRVGMLRGFRV